MSAITIYVKPTGCFGCSQSKKILNDAGVPFESVDITTDDDALAFVKNVLGFESVPAFLLDGITVKDQDGAEIDRWWGLRPDLLDQLKLLGA